MFLIHLELHLMMVEILCIVIELSSVLQVTCEWISKYSNV